MIKFLIVLSLLFLVIFPSSSSGRIEEDVVDKLEFHIVHSGQNLKFLGNKASILTAVPLELDDEIGDYDTKLESLVFIPLGERLTGGYSIELLYIEELKDNRIRITLSEVTPPAGSMVTMAKTYPGIIILVNRVVHDIEIEWKIITT